MPDDSPLSADDVARRVVLGGTAPLCAAGWRARAGAAGTWIGEEGGARDVFFDLASVTKPMIAVAVAASGLDPRAPLGSLLPEAVGTASERASIELLLSHRAGLDAHRPLYAPLLEGRAIDPTAALREAADARRPELPGDPPEEGFPPLYSDLGYVLVGEAVARSVGAHDAGEAIERLVLGPLGALGDAGTVRGLAGRGVSGPFAATETVPWRGGVVCGSVHDENAWALTGLGGSGHAGVFARAGAVLAFGAAVLDRLEGRPSPFAADLGWLVRPRPGGTLRAGFDGKSEQGSSAGTLMGARSFGHLGFTGTSLWIDPDDGVVIVLLTNRVCPSRDSSAIRAARPWANDALVDRAHRVRRSRGSSNPRSPGG